MAADSPSLPGSARRPIADARAAGDLDPAATVEVTVVLRRAGAPPEPDPYAPPLTREQAAELLGADPADVAAVTEALTGAGLEVTAVDQPSRRVQARGDVTTLARVFGTPLSLVESADPLRARAVVHRQRSGEITLPPPLADVVVAVLGLDD